MTTDIYQVITDKIVAAIEAGAGEWRMPWHSRDGVTPSAQPVSLSTGKRYRGMNTILLWVAQQERGYDSALWGTFQSWKEKGASVRKGETGTQILFWKQIDRTVTNDAGEDETERHLIAKAYYVFNVAQVDGFKAGDEPVADLPLNARIEGAERFFEGLRFDVRHGGGRAFCRLQTGHIQLPEFQAFDSAQDYYSTRAHESVHRSGHPDRLDRVFGRRFGDDEYAAEELVAELGAAFLCSHIGISNEPRPDHAAYLSSWLRVLKNDKRAIFTAASKAQQAADYLIDLTDRYQGASEAVVDVVSEPPATPVAQPEPVPVVSPATPNRQWEPNPKFVPCKRSLKTGRKLRWRTYFGYRPSDGLTYPPMSSDALSRQAKLYRAWVAERDAAIAARNEEMPLAAD